MTVIIIALTLLVGAMVCNDARELFDREKVISKEQHREVIERIRKDQSN